MEFFGYFGDWLRHQPPLVQAWTIGQSNMQRGSLLHEHVLRSFRWLTKALRFTENYGREQYFNGVKSLQDFVEAAEWEGFPEEEIAAFTQWHAQSEILKAL